MSLIYNLKFKLIKIIYPIKIKNTVAKYTGRIYVGGPSFVTKNTYLGSNVCFNGMKIFGNGRVDIGNNFHSGSGCQIITSFHNYNGNAIPYDDTFIDKNVIIEDNVWLGNNVIILGGVSIGEGAIIQAGSVVCKNVPKYSIAGGHPAIPFKQRDVEVYEKNKQEKNFH